VWKQLVQFCIIVGDSESAIIFDQSRSGYVGMLSLSLVHGSSHQCPAETNAIQHSITG
jgi:hypothetical protein